MLKCLKVGSSNIFGAANIVTNNRINSESVGCTTLDSSVVLSCTINKTFKEWYEAFLERKRNVLRYGGTVTVDGITVISSTGDSSICVTISEGGFDDVAKGETVSEYLDTWRGYLRSIQGVTPDSRGNIHIIPDKYIDVSSNALMSGTSSNYLDVVDDNSIAITRAPGFFNPNSYYKRLMQMELLIYDSINYQADRLRIGEWDVPGGKITQSENDEYENEYTVVSNPLPAGFGPRLDTIRNYQAIVARWNHNAWLSSMVMDIERLPGSASISLGYVALDCDIRDVVIVSEMDYKGLVDLETGDEVQDTEAVKTYSNNFTVYHCGTDSGTELKATWEIKRNGAVCNGTGYLGGSAGNKMTNARITITIEPHSTGAATTGEVKTMMPERYHYETFSIATPSASLEYYEPQDTVKYVHRYSVATTWIVNGGGEERTSFEKTGLLDVPAVNVRVANDDDDDPSNPDSPAAASVEYGVLTDDGRFQPLDLSGTTPTADGVAYNMETPVTIYKTGVDEPDYGDN